jgi:putative transposase
MQNLKIQFKLSPSKEESEKLWQIAGSMRYIWNYFLALEMKTYEETKLFNFYHTNAASLTELKKQEAHKWLNDVPSTGLQQVLENLNKALKNYFEYRAKLKACKDPSKRLKIRKVGFPKFHKKSRGHGSFEIKMINFKRSYKDGCLKFGKNKIFIANHARIPTDFKTCTIKYKGGFWYVSFVSKRKIPKKREIYKTIGIDLNSKYYVTRDKKYAVPKTFLENQKKLAQLQRKLARQTKDSNKYNETLHRFQKLNAHCTIVLHDWLHKLSNELVENYDMIAIEDLNVASMKSKFGKVVKNNGFAKFRKMLEYKCELRGKTLVVVDRWFPSSQLCSHCGARHKHKINERTYKCPDCGNIMCRDKNASINLEYKGQEQVLVGFLSAPLPSKTIDNIVDNFNEHRSATYKNMLDTIVNRQKNSDNF